jgi:hypothetical protein
MRLVIVLFLLLNIAGCGSSAVEITVHHTDDYEYLQSLSREWIDGRKVDGFAVWKSIDVVNIEKCDIYLMYPEWYRNESVYNEIYGHEVRHCFEHDYHE